MYYVVFAYFTYIVISVSVTVWVARTLHHNGRVFLVDVFHGDETMADSVNHLLVVGFYLVNFGFVALALRTDDTLVNSRQSIELVSGKIGVVMLVLGAMHFFNLYVFSRMRKRAQIDVRSASSPARQ